MLSQTHEYALRAMTQLASETSNASTSDRIAVASGVPRAGLTTSRRGVGGGVKLSRPPKKISLLQVVNAVDPLTRKLDAPKGKQGVALAPLNRKVDAIVGQLQKSLAATSLADVAKRPSK